MKKVAASIGIGLVVVYALGVAVFAASHYEGRRPPILTVLGDFHGWVGSGFQCAEAPAPSAPVPPPLPPLPVAPPPPEPPQTPTPTVAEMEPTDAETKELRRIEKVLLPEIAEKAKALRASERGDGIEYNRTRSEAMAALGEARTFLDAILQKDPHHRQANRLWTTLQELYAALKRL